MRKQLVTMAILIILATITVAATVTNVNADSDSGNNGQCRQGTETASTIEQYFQLDKN